SRTASASPEDATRPSTMCRSRAVKALPSHTWAPVMVMSPVRMQYSSEKSAQAEAGGEGVPIVEFDRRGPDPVSEAADLRDHAADGALGDAREKAGADDRVVREHLALGQLA